MEEIVKLNLKPHRCRVIARNERENLVAALITLFLATPANASPLSAPSSFYRNPYIETMTMKNAKPIKKDGSSYEKTLAQAKDLEAVLVSTMVEPMFPRGKESGLYGGGEGSDIYRSMMIQEYGKILSRGNSLGLAENIARNLTNK